MAFSDIHIDINSARKSHNFEIELIEYLSNLDGDILIFTGDIAGQTKKVFDFLEITSSLNFETKLFVPGNHDLWVNQNSEDLSKVKYYEIFPEICERLSWHYLPNDPLIIDNTVFLGTTGWYDYSSRNRIWDNQYNLSDYAKKKHPLSNMELSDRHYIRFGSDDIDIANQFNQDLVNDFEYVHQRISPSEINNYVILSHVVPFEKFIVYRGIFKYDYFTAFFGNFNLGQVIRDNTGRNTCYSFFGQTHIPNHKLIDNRIEAYCVPIGYPREYGRNISLQKLFRNRIKLLDI